MQCELPQSRHHNPRFFTISVFKRTITAINPIPFIIDKPRCYLIVMNIINTLFYFFERIQQNWMKAILPKFFCLVYVIVFALEPALITILTFDLYQCFLFLIILVTQIIMNNMLGSVSIAYLSRNDLKINFLYKCRTNDRLQNCGLCSS